MISFLRENIGLLGIIAFLFIVGNFAPAIVGISLSIIILLVLIGRGDYDYSLMLFIVILIFSDNLEMTFAATAKTFLILIITLGAWRLKGSESFNTSIISGFMVFFIFAAMLLPLSESIAISFQKNLSYVLLFFAIPVISLESFRIKGVDFLKALIYLEIIILIGCLLSRYVDPNWALSHEGRLRGVFGNPNGLGMFCYFVMVFITCVSRKFPEAFSKRELIMIYGVVAITIIASSARTSILALMLFFTLDYFLKGNFILSLGLILVFVFFNQYFMELIIFIAYSFDLEQYLRIDTIDTGSGRLVAWKFAWEHIQDNLFFGKGWAFDEYLFNLKQNRTMLRLQNHQGGVHNVFLGFMLNTGITGLVIFLTSFYLMFQRINRHSPLAFPIMFSSLFMCNFEPWLLASLNPYTIHLILFWVILGLMESEEPSAKTESELAVNKVK